MRAAIYTRISQDATGEGAGVARQLDLCRKLCASRGWDVVATLEENDTSASKGPRPVYDDLVAAIEADSVDVVVAYHLDRLTRRPSELETLLDLCEPRGVLVATVTGDLDLTTPDGRMVARMLASVARAEVERAGARRRAANDQRAAQGLKGAGARPFGYLPDRVTPDPVEAPLVVAAVADVLAGVSFAEIARRWKADGVPAVRGGQWTVSSVKSVLTGPHQAGMLVHRGEIVGPGAWPAIVDPADRERLLAALASRRLTFGPPRRGPFTGLVRCDRCGVKMQRAQNRHKGREGTRWWPMWRCPTCGRCVNSDPVEHYVVGMLLDASDHGDLASRLKASRHADDLEATRQLRADLDQREAELTEVWAGGGLSRQAWQAGLERIRAERAGAERVLARLAAAEDAARMLGPAGALRSSWPTSTDEQKRTTLHHLIDSVGIGPAGSNRRTDPIAARVSITWRF